MQELIILLDEAVELSSQYTGGYSIRFSSAEEFYDALRDSVSELKKGNTEILNELWIWFAPTCDWDDLIRMEGLELGNRIYEKLNVIMKR